MKNLESRELKFPIVEDFLTKLKKEFSDRNNKSTNIAELKKVKQRSKTRSLYKSSEGQKDEISIRKGSELRNSRER